MSAAESINQSNAIYDVLHASDKPSSSPSSERMKYALMELPYYPALDSHPSFECYTSLESCPYGPKQVEYVREGSGDFPEHPCESPLVRSYPATPEQYYPSASSYSSLSERSCSLSPNTQYSFSLPYQPPAIYNSPYLQTDKHEAFLKPVSFTDGKAPPSRSDYCCVLEVGGISESPASLGVYGHGRSISAPASPTPPSEKPDLVLYGAVTAPQLVWCDSSPSAADDDSVPQSTVSISSLGLSYAPQAPATDGMVSLLSVDLVSPQAGPSAASLSAANSNGLHRHEDSKSLPGTLNAVGAPQFLWNSPSASSSLRPSITLTPVERPKLAPSRAINGVVSFPRVRPSCSFTLSLQPVSPWAATSKKRSNKENKENPSLWRGRELL
ncbi:hypothetical protein LshimejAT787_0704370 [Lyophyllum shimeji]|uniref:Uncharacterized protein n=1 Tax=Lyophyllum shimeji TaxID=47721 RepID=A0A9P3UP33_LYOSH|nr:hypothetical protein LshimejAT787_0704370 [Lyophyllum shimeji]